MKVKLSEGERKEEQKGKEKGSREVSGMNRRLEEVDR